MVPRDLTGAQPPPDTAEQWVTTADGTPDMSRIACQIRPVGSGPHDWVPGCGHPLSQHTASPLLICDCCAGRPLVPEKWRGRLSRRKRERLEAKARR